MSKIYEALLRAELERTLSQGENAPAEAPSSERYAVAPNDNDPSAEPLESVALPTLETPPNGYEASTSLRSKEHTWQPVFSHLPALDKHGRPVEQFRSLRSHLTAVRDLNPLKSILISSGMPGEGKSFLAVNLALSFARHRSNRVLLIDGDLRKGSLHKLLGAPQGPGLAEYLAGSAEVSSIVQRDQRTAAKPNLGLAALAFIPSGEDPLRAGDLSGSPRFADLISMAEREFDWIIIDTSPAIVVSDSINLARACDGVLLVAREGVTKYETAQQAQTQFKGANVIGFVLNAAHRIPQQSEYGASYTYVTENRQIE